MKQKRQAMILSLIDKYDIETQDELTKRLREMGFAVTQATVSRDMRELNLTKTAVGGGKNRYALERDGYGSADSYRKVLSTGILSMVPSENLIVVKTVPGMAMAAAAALDNSDVPGLLGSIAGDDTIFLAADSRDDTWQVISFIDRLRRS